MGCEGFLANTLNFPQNVTLDMSTLSIFGHSFGATTAIAVAAKNDKIKGCCPIEASFAPHMSELSNIVVEDTPLFHVRADDYWNLNAHGYDQRRISEKYFFLVKQENFKLQRATIVDSTHISFTDYLVLLPYLTSRFCGGDCVSTVANKYMATVWL